MSPYSSAWVFGMEMYSSAGAGLPTSISSSAAFSPVES